MRWILVAKPLNNPLNVCRGWQLDDIAGLKHYPSTIFDVVVRKTLLDKEISTVNLMEV